MRILKSHLPFFRRFLEINGWYLCKRKLPWEFERWNKEDVFLIGRANNTDEFVSYHCSRKDSNEFDNLVKMWNDFLRGVAQNEEKSEGMDKKGNRFYKKEG